MLNLPEPAYRGLFAEVSAELDRQVDRLAQLIVHNPDGTSIVAALLPQWLPWPGLPGCRVYHVPNPDGSTAPFLAICQMGKNVESRGAHLDESRLVALMKGKLTVDGEHYRNGQVFWIAPGQPIDWWTVEGCLAAILYDAPPHDIDVDLLPPS